MPIPKELYKYNNITAYFLAHLAGGRSYYPGIPRLADLHSKELEEILIYGTEITPEMDQGSIDAIRSLQFIVMQDIADQHGGFESFMRQVGQK